MKLCQVMLFLFSSFCLLSSMHAQELHSPQRSAGSVGDLQWQVYFTMPLCENETQKKNVWCTFDDIWQAEKDNGVIDRLLQVLRNPLYNHLYFSYFSFKNSKILQTICRETSAREEMSVTLFISSDNVGATNDQFDKIDSRLQAKLQERYRSDCRRRIDIQPRSEGFGKFIQHSKILVASEKEIPNRPEDIASWARLAGEVTFTTSSANMSSTGPSINFENWLFFVSPSSNYVAQQNVCVMTAFNNYQVGGPPEREQFKADYKKCLDNIVTKPRRDMTFYMVPSIANNRGDGPEASYKEMIRQARSSIKVAIHRFTSASLARPLIEAQKKGRQVQVLYDDDTLITGVEDFGPAIDVGGDDIETYQALRRAGTEIRFMETSGDNFQMFHNKFVVVDGETVFQGAGNFTAKAMNAGGRDGNYEQFYQFKIPDLVAAYERAYDYLYTLATRREDHYLGSGKDMCTEYVNGQSYLTVVPCREL